jgi:hypothetical protein
MPTLCTSYTFHSGADRLGLRVDIPFCGGKIAVPGKVRQSVGIHVSRPTGQAGVAERVQREWLDFRQFDGFCVLLLQSGFLNVAAAS